MPLSHSLNRLDRGSNGSAPFDMFQWMDVDLQAAFNNSVRRRHFTAGQIIYLQGEPGTEMFRLLEGSVRLAVIRSDGREAVFMLFEPGDCFGDSSLVDGGPRPQTAEAMTDIWVDVLDGQAFADLRAKYRTFDDALLKLLAMQMRMVSEQYAYSNLHGLRSRVAARLVEAARSFGAEVDGGTRLTLRLNQSELAAMVGASRQSVNKVLQRLQSDGLVTIEYGNVLVRDIAGLNRLSL